MDQKSGLSGEHDAFKNRRKIESGSIQRLH
jgi:hypothetical protein